MIRALVDEIERRLAKRQRIAVATLFSQRGSTPRTAGAKMLVRADGSIAGTIGGGLVEAQVIDAAVEAIASGKERVCHFDLGGELGESADLICGGKMDVLVDVIDVEQQEVFVALAAALRRGSRCALITAWRAETEEIVERHHSLVFYSTEQSPVGAEPPLPQAELRALSRRRAVWFAEREGKRILFEPFFTRGTVYLFGGGHVSLPVAELCQQVGFRVEVFDDREEFANRERFGAADDVTVCVFDGVLSELEIDRESYLVIVTRGHSHDRTVLEQALRSDAGYIGMIGSRRKRDAIYAALRKDGFGDEDLARVHCPVGLPIKAETPEEIAVSIVAELIACRAELAG